MLNFDAFELVEELLQESTPMTWFGLIRSEVTG